MKDPRGDFAAGCEILNEVLVPTGFRFVVGPSGSSSGGPFASGAYVNGDRAIELHFRHSLGLVAYRIGEVKVDHPAMMQALGAEGQHAYPGFSDDPLDGFRHLRMDLERHGTPFLTGPDAAATALVAAAQRLQAERRKGLAALP